MLNKYRLVLISFVGCWLIQLLASRPLWLRDSFPRIPLLDLWGDSAVWADGVFLGCLVVSLGVLGWDQVQLTSGRRRCLWLGGLVGFAGLILTDVNRLQPWVWHSILLMIWSLFVPAPNYRWGQGLIYLTASIYIGSALSKTDHSFLQSYGQQLLGTLLEAIGISTRWWSPVTKLTLAASLPLGEFITGLLLLMPKTRRWGLYLSLGMHVGFIVVVGPWGLGHSYSVLLWNVYFLIQNWLLLKDDAFDKTRLALCQGFNGLCACRNCYEFLTCATAGEPLRQSRGRIDILALAVCWSERCFWCLIFSLPIFRFYGYVDHWLGWAVYATDIEQVSFYVHQSVEHRLPTELRGFIEPSQFQDEWRVVRFDQWCVSSCRVPLYPQDRVRIELAKWLIHEAQLKDSEWRLMWKSRPQWRSEERRVIEIDRHDRLGIVDQ